MGSFGYITDTTPFLDSLTKRGTLFKRAYAQSATTQPSHASMFTGLYPLQHNVRRNGEVLDEAFVTMAEFLRDRGYATAAFTSTNAHFQWGGLSQGFDHYDELALPEGVEKLSQAERADRPEKTLYRPADRTIDQMIRWIEELEPSASFFLWIHLFDPHRPFMPPMGYLWRISSTSRRPSDQLDRREFLRTQHQIASIDEQRLFDNILRYDAEIAFVDAEIERAFYALEKRGLNDNSLWIITSDHGQGLETHDGWFGHTRQIYNVQLHVPLILYFDSGWQAGTLIEDRVVEHADLLPTVADLLNTDVSEQLFAVQGRSLLPLIEGNPSHYEKDYAFGQRSDYSERRRQQDSARGGNFTLQTAKRKYILFNFGPDEFYDLTTDPYEMVNVIDQEDPARQELLEKLKEIIGDLDNQMPAINVDEATLERLRALGYIQ